MTTQKTGTLYGIGVGPGDPELMTLKSTRILSQVDVVYAAASTKNPYSLAVSIAKPHIPVTTAVHMLSFPMTRDRNVTQKAWQENARIIVETVEQGKDAAFLTLGDAMTYSTFGYILKYIQRDAPHVPVETVPGITSYQAAAACLNTPLVEGEESLLITSGVQGGDRIRSLPQKPETLVLLKAYRNIKDIAAALQEADMGENCVCVSNCGLDTQRVVRGVKDLNGRPPDYWTLIIAKRPREHGTP